MIIKLTDDRFEKFYLNSELIETFRNWMGKSEILLTTGRVMSCIESPETLAEIINESKEAKE